MAVLDIRIDVAISDSPKLWHMEQRVGPGALAYLVKLWAWGRVSSLEGVLGKLHPPMVERKLGWDGEPGALWDALTTPAEGFAAWIELKGGSWSIHDWAEHQEYASDQKTAREHGRVGGLRSAESRRSKGVGQGGSEGGSEGGSKPSPPSVPSYPPSETVGLSEGGGSIQAHQTPALPRGLRAASGGESTGAATGPGPGRTEGADTPKPESRRARANREAAERSEAEAAEREEAAYSRPRDPPSEEAVALSRESVATIEVDLAALAAKHRANREVSEDAIEARRASQLAITRAMIATSPPAEAQAAAAGNGDGTCQLETPNTHRKSKPPTTRETGKSRAPRTRRPKPTEP